MMAEQAETEARMALSGVRSRGAKRAIVGAAIVAALALVVFWPQRDAPYNWLAVNLGWRPLLAARSWHYQLTDADVDTLSRSSADLMVIDYATHKGHLPLTAEDVARLKRKPDGSPRLVVAYMSIGEAEIWRWYWQTDWQPGHMPDWEVAENCSWPGAHMVRFWLESWRDVIYRERPGGTKPYLARIVDAGFDGVYLDRVDVWEQLLVERPTARADMIGFVRDLAFAARRWKPGFLVIPQNADALLDDRGYRRTIDGLGKEDLLFGTNGSDQRNPDKDIVWSKRQLAKLLGDGKPVFAVEYPSQPANVESAKAEYRALGIVATVQNRTLNGTDFVTDTRAKEDIEGTPEWIAAKCKDKRWW